MRVRCARGSWLGMTTSGSSSITATATAAVCAKRRLTRTAVVPSSSSSSQAGFPQQQQQQQASAVPQSLFASLATLATAATASPTFAAKSSSSNSSSSHHQSSYHHRLHLHHHHHHHYHHQPYHPYPKPSGSSTNNSSHGSGDETEDDERADFQAEFNFPHEQLQVQQQQQLQQQPRPQRKPQFHPQHHHPLIAPVRQHRTSNNSSHHSHNSMPRRKETKKIQIDMPSSEACSGIEGDPHQVFKCNGSPIISPRSIRNSLAETDFDLDGNPRPQKIANTQMPNGITSSKSSSIANGTGSHAAATIGPALPPPDVASPATSTSSNDKKKSSRRRKQQPQEDPETETANGNGRTQNEMDLLALKVEEQSLSGMTGVQLWVHRLLYTHHQTLHVLGLERADFPNTRLSMKQLECMLSPVISLANMMTPDHFGIHVPTPQVAQTMNDVHYWKLWESDTIDIGIFFMPPDAHIPLHNHPGMSVVTRILYGSVNIRSYDLVSPQELGEDAAEVVSESTEIVGSDPKVKWARMSREGAYASESTMWLDPRRFNLHQIHAASDNGCALLDIMIPPYNNADRDCHHFKIIEERYNKDKNERIVKMLKSITADNHNEPTETAPPRAPAPSSPSQSESQSESS